MSNNSEYMYLGLCQTANLNDYDYTDDNKIHDVISATSYKYTYIRMTNKIRKFINLKTDFNEFMQKFVEMSLHEVVIYESKKPRQFITEATDVNTFNIFNTFQTYTYPNYTVWNDGKLHNYILAINWKQ